MNLRSRMPINIKKIEAFIDGLELSQRALADQMGISATNVCRTFKGERDVGISFIVGLRRLGMKSESIFLVQSGSDFKEGGGKKQKKTSSKSRK